MKIKKGASLAGLQIEMRPALMAAEKIWVNYGRELVITSGTDGEHSAGSLHYYGYAVDFRTRYFDFETLNQVYQDLRLELPAEFRIKLESTHMHVEYYAALKKGGPWIH